MDALLRPSPSGFQGRWVERGLVERGLVELEGELSSGRTALAHRWVAEVTARGQLAGWVDLPDALDPRSLRRSGADLEALLWVRPPTVAAALRAAELLLKTGFAIVVIDLGGADARALQRSGVAGWSRLLRAARQARATALLLGSGRASGAFATLGIHTERRRALFEGGLFEGLECTTTVMRNRTGPDGAAWPLRVTHRPVPR